MVESSVSVSDVTFTCTNNLRETMRHWQALRPWIPKALAWNPTSSPTCCVTLINSLTSLGLSHLSKWQCHNLQLGTSTASNKIFGLNHFLTTKFWPNDNTVLPSSWEPIRCNLGREDEKGSGFRNNVLWERHKRTLVITYNLLIPYSLLKDSEPTFN